MKTTLWLNNENHADAAAADDDDDDVAGKDTVGSRESECDFRDTVNFGRGKTSVGGCRHIQFKYASPDMTLHVVSCDGFGFGGHITNIASMYVPLISALFLHVFLQHFWS